MLLHGDIRADNMFFDGDRMKVVDFQFAARGLRRRRHRLPGQPGAADRGARGHDEALVREYLEYLGAHGVTDYSFDEAWRQYRSPRRLPDGAAGHHAQRLGRACRSGPGVCA